MSILETFYILFKGDSTDVKKAAKESEHAVQSLSEALTGTFRKVDQSTQKVNRSFYDLAKAAVAFVGASTAAYRVFHETVEASNYAGHLGNVSAALGVNASQLDAWSQAVKYAGGSAEGFQNSLRGLSRHFGTNAATTLELLPRLADAFKRLGNYRAQYYGKLLGLDEPTILLLQQGRREVEAWIRQIKELSTVTQKDIDISNNYTLSVFKLGLAFRGLYLSIAQTVIPIFTKLYESVIPFIQYITRHKDLVIGAFIGIGIAAGLMLAPFVIANAAILLTIASIGLLISLFAVAYEDIKAFIEGNQSLIGDLGKRWSNFGTLIMDLSKGIRKALELAFFPLTGAIKATEYLMSLFKSNGKINFGLQGGQTLLDSINSSPLNSRNSTSNFLSQGFARNSNINTGDIVIHTEATDATGIAKDFTKELLSRHLWQTNNQFANGEAY